MAMMTMTGWLFCYQLVFDTDRTPEEVKLKLAIRPSPGTSFTVESGPRKKQGPGKGETCDGAGYVETIH